MSQPFDRRDILRIGLAACAALAAPAARGCEFFAPTLRIAHPWTRATDPDAKFAVVCMSFDQVTQTDRLVAVHTPVAAKAELGGQGKARDLDLLIPEGRETVLSESGVHLRLVGLTSALEVGRTYPLTLVFDVGGSVRAQLTVDYERFT